VYLYSPHCKFGVLTKPGEVQWFLRVFLPKEGCNKHKPERNDGDVLRHASKHVHGNIETSKIGKADG